MIALSSRFSTDCSTLWTYSAPKIRATAYFDGVIVKLNNAINCGLYLTKKSTCDFYKSKNFEIL